MSYQSAYRETIGSKIGRETLDAVRQFAAQQVEFSAMDAINDACSKRGCVDCWHVLNALDQLVTEGVIRELTDRAKVMGQNRRYRGGGV